MLAQYFTFQGRATRYQYWMFVLVNLGAVIVANLVDAALLSRIDLNDPAALSGGAVLRLIPYATLITVLAFFIPGLCVTVRRLHDRDKSGWFYFIAFVPVVGFIWLLVEVGFLRGTYGPNRFGPDPLGDPYGYGYPPQYPPTGAYPEQPGLPQAGYPQYPQAPGYPPQQGYPSQQGSVPQVPPQPYPPQYPPQGR